MTQRELIDLEECIEYHRLNGRQVIFESEGAWYKIPFFLLEDWCSDWANNRIIQKYSKNGHADGVLGPDQPLRAWLKEVDEQEAYPPDFDPDNFQLSDLVQISDQNDVHLIRALKEILIDELPALLAYKIY